MTQAGGFSVKHSAFHVLLFMPYNFFNSKESWDFSAAEVIWRACHCALNTVLICNANNFILIWIILLVT